MIITVNGQKIEGECLGEFTLPNDDIVHGRIMDISGQRLCALKDSSGWYFLHARFLAKEIETHEKMINKAKAALALLEG